MNHKILITGAAGFIGFHLSKHLLEKGYSVVGVDNLNSYYDIQLKKARLQQLQPFPEFEFVKADISERATTEALFANNNFMQVVNLAAQAGVRYSLDNPHAYMNSNMVGFLNILEGCRHSQVDHLVFASSSSVYGITENQPLSVDQRVDHPVSLYAATKKSNELMAHAYAHLYGLPVTGLRLFTVYGPWGRPDMSYFLFTKAILDNQPIDVFNHGRMKRDFTYVGDVVGGIAEVLNHVPTANTQSLEQLNSAAPSCAPFKLYNVGNNQPTKLVRFIELLEEALEKKAQKNFLPMQPGDVLETYADVTKLRDEVGFNPQTPLRDGLQRFVDWYRMYYRYEKKRITNDYAQ